MNPMEIADLMKLVNARRTPNNYRKMHGEKTIRYKHLKKLHNKRVKDFKIDVASFYPSSSMLYERKD